MRKWGEGRWGGVLGGGAGNMAYRYLMLLLKESMYMYIYMYALSTDCRAMKKAVQKLESKHNEHIEAYDPNKGEDNKRRLTGLHETSHIGSFSAGRYMQDMCDADVPVPRRTVTELR